MSFDDLASVFHWALYWISLDWIVYFIHLLLYATISLFLCLYSWLNRLIFDRLKSYNYFYFASKNRAKFDYLKTKSRNVKLAAIDVDPVRR